MFDKLKTLDIEFTSEKEKELKEFVNYFIQYNQNVNLMSRNDADVIFEKHIYDSLALNLFIKKYSIDENIKLLDIGTGGGFPSVPLAFLYRAMEINAVDSVNKKINFIKTVKEKFNLKNLNPITSRVEDLPEKSIYDVVVSRAMAQFRIILEYAIPYLKTGGFFIAYKSIKADEEIKNAQRALSVLNAKIIDKIEYSLPLKEDNKRILILVKKLSDTPVIYPRSNGLIKKKPL